MAILSDQQARALIKAPTHQRELQRAREKRTRHSLHTEAETSVTELTFAASQFLDWCKGLLKGPGNYARFVQLARPPFPTNKLTESIFNSFEKIFDGANAFQTFEFTTPEAEADFIDYRKRIGDNAFWPTQGMAAFKYSIDNMLVIDLPRLDRDEQGVPINAADRPEPYYYMLDIDRIHDVENSRVTATDTMTGNEFVYFKTEYLVIKGKSITDASGKMTRVYYVLDDAAYRLYHVIDGAEPVLMSVESHDLGYCPARSFWTTPLNDRTTIQKSGPITDTISDLDWLLFFQLAERYLQLYAPFPVYATYKKKCNYTVKSKDGSGLEQMCVNGSLVYKGFVPVPGQNYPTCPSCGGEVQIGPGAIFVLEPPRETGTGGDPDLMSNPLKVIPAETTSLNYIQARIEALRNEITVNCIGRSKDTNSASAKNEMQVESGFASSEEILTKTKRNFELIQSFALDTIARLRYGEEYMGGTINLGDQFFVKDETQEMNEYKAAKENNLPSFDIAERRRSLNAARYRNDPKMIERLNVLEHLEPFSDMSISEVIDFKKSNGDFVDDVEFIIKTRFTDLVARFEREQTDVVTFGRKLQFDKKIDLIAKELTKYALEWLNTDAEGNPLPKPGAADPQNPGAPPPVPGAPPQPPVPPVPQPPPVPVPA